MTLPPYLWFWIFIVLFFVTGLVIPVIAYILEGRRRGTVKEDTFECGQEVDIRPSDVRIAGAGRYFAYAVAFFVLDALTWIIMASASAAGAGLSPIPVIVYVGVIMAGIYFFVKGIEELRG